jgi:hypothetical protein
VTLCEGIGEPDSRLCSGSPHGTSSWCCSFREPALRPGPPTSTFVARGGGAPRACQGRSEDELLHAHESQLDPAGKSGSEHSGASAINRRCRQLSQAVFQRRCRKMFLPEIARTHFIDTGRGPATRPFAKDIDDEDLPFPCRRSRVSDRLRTTQLHPWAASAASRARAMEKCRCTRRPLHRPACPRGCGVLRLHPGIADLARDGIHQQPPLPLVHPLRALCGRISCPIRGRDAKAPRPFLKSAATAHHRRHPPQDREARPQHGNGSCISHILGLVNFRRRGNEPSLLLWQARNSS